MKTITFLRHSKSSWEYDVSDINRPLNEFGINKIKKVSNLSGDTFNHIEILFSSPANRAIHTCIILANTLEIDLKKLLFVMNCILLTCLKCLILLNKLMISIQTYF